MTHEIPKEEVQFPSLSYADNAGRVFFWKGRIFRAIASNSEETVRQMFSSGMIKELVDKQLFPKSWITDFSFHGYSIVLEHERFCPVSYPYEWSFGMLKGAALTVLRINSIARKYGYQLKDCHGFNVIFDGIRPKFVDLGSLVGCPDAPPGWLAYAEFIKAYYFPLRIWQHGNGFIARKILESRSLMPDSCYLLYRWPIARFINLSILEKAFNNLFRLKSFSEEVPLIPTSSLSMRLLRSMAKKRFLPFMKVSMDKWIRRIQRLNRKSQPTMWGTYHDEFFHEGALSSPRFDRIVCIVKGLAPTSVLELAGNQGALSCKLAEQLPKTPIICTDADENAVEALYTHLGKTDLKISPALLDFVFPAAVSFAEQPQIRFRSHAVLALAVTHHLTLTARIPLEVVLRSIASYSAEYVLVEFMPLGLHNGQEAPPLPDWYNIEWFRGHFVSQFELIMEERLEQNRVLFVGRLRH